LGCCTMRLERYRANDKLIPSPTVDVSDLEGTDNVDGDGNNTTHDKPQNIDYINYYNFSNQKVQTVSYENYYHYNAAGTYTWRYRSGGVWVDVST